MDTLWTPCGHPVDTLWTPSMRRSIIFLYTFYKRNILYLFVLHFVDGGLFEGGRLFKRGGAGGYLMIYGKNPLNKNMTSENYSIRT